MHEERPKNKLIWEIKPKGFDYPLLPWGRDGILVIKIDFQNESSCDFHLVLPLNLYANFARELNLLVSFSGIRRFIALETQYFGEEFAGQYKKSELPDILSGFHCSKTLNKILVGPIEEGRFFCIGAYDKVYIIDLFDSGYFKITEQKVYE